MRILGLFATIVMLSGCSMLYDDPPTIIQTCPQHEIPTPTPLKLDSIGRIVVITPETVDKKFEDIKNSGTEPTLVCISPQGYKALSLNMEKIQGYIQVLRETAK